jgi:hypothetical protein
MNGQWVVTDVVTKAAWVRGTCPTGKLTSSTTATITTVQYWGGTSPGSTFTAQDPDGQFSNSTGHAIACLCQYRPEYDDYLIVTMTC